jgi:hypothetical protein
MQRSQISTNSRRSQSARVEEELQVVEQLKQMESIIGHPAVALRRATDDWPWNYRQCVAVRL